MLIRYPPQGNSQWLKTNKQMQKLTGKKLKKVLRITKGNNLQNWPLAFKYLSKVFVFQI